MKAGLFYLEFLRSVVRGVESEEQDDDIVAEAGEDGGLNVEEEEEIENPKKKKRIRKKPKLTLKRIHGLKDKMAELKIAIESAIMPDLEKDELEKRLREFYKEKKDKQGLKDIKSTVEEYADKQYELFKMLKGNYPDSDFSWFTNDPELYKFNHGKTSARGKIQGAYIPSGYAQTLNHQQSEALDELWQSFEGTEYLDFLKNEDTNPEGDTWLLRFLRATMQDKRSKGKRIFQVGPARERLISTIKWKGVYVPQYQPERFSEYRRLKPNLVLKDMKAEAVVMIEKAGRFWTNCDPEYFEEEDWAFNFAYAVEQAETRRRELQKELGVTDDPGIMVIMDVKGIGMGARKCQDLFKIYNAIAGDNYPELIRKIYVVNAPWVFARVFSVVKLFVDPDTIAKVEVHKGIPKKALLNVFDPETLPTEYGGNSEQEVPVSTFYKEGPEL